MISRKKALNVFEEAAQCLGSYDDFPLMPAGTDPMACLSRNRVPQPFFLASENDQVLVTLSGACRVEMPGSSPAEVELRSGEALYLPAGQSSRVIPEGECLQLKWKAEPGGWEAAVWLCRQCGRELYRREADTSKTPAQEAYWKACEEFNGDVAHRTCPHCRAVNPEADLTDIRWAEVAAHLRAQDAGRPAD
jgi:hypothetical protein